MNNFAIGDIVFTKAIIAGIDHIDATSVYRVRSQLNGGVGFLVTEVYPIPTKTYEDGLKEAWEVAQKIGCFEADGGLSDQQAQEIFGTSRFTSIFRNFSPTEAIEKIEAWKEAKDIHVGDIVTASKASGKSGIVTGVVNREYYVLWNDGSTNRYTYDMLRKTGRTFDVAGLLEQIGSHKKCAD